MNNMGNETEFVMTRLTKLYLASLVDANFDYFRFGGWYELFSLGDNGFRRHDYAVAIISVVQPNLLVHKYVRLLDIGGWHLIVEIVIRNQQLTDVDIRYFNIKDYLSPKLIPMGLDLLDLGLVQALITPPEGMILLQQKQPGNFLCGYTTHLPFSFESNGGLCIKTQETNLKRLIDEMGLQV